MNAYYLVIHIAPDRCDIFRWLFLTSDAFARKLSPTVERTWRVYVHWCWVGVSKEGVWFVILFGWKRMAGLLSNQYLLRNTWRIYRNYERRKLVWGVSKCSRYVSKVRMGFSKLFNSIFVYVCVGAVEEAWRVVGISGGCQNIFLWRWSVCP